MPPCYHPLDARKSPGGTIGFKPMTPFDKLIKLPCGRCTGCRLEKSRQWAVRLMHEAQLHERTSFITLTYNNENLPNRAAPTAAARSVAPGLPQPLDRHARTETRTHAEQKRAATLVPTHLQKFTKRLNESCRRRFGQGIRYYACGEYGDRTHRPHYHIAVYGEDFKSDRVFWKNTQGGNPLYRSKHLAKLWDLGDADIGELTFESAAYIARYVMKKINGKNADDHYRQVDPDGEEHWLEPEFARMSRRPGLGAKWFEAYNASVYPHDRVIVRGRPSKPPRIYDEYLKKTDQALYELVKMNRELGINPENSTPERLRAGEAILAAAQQRLKRPLE